MQVTGPSAASDLFRAGGGYPRPVSRASLRAPPSGRGPVRGSEGCCGRHRAGRRRSSRAGRGLRPASFCSSARRPRGVPAELRRSSAGRASRLPYVDTPGRGFRLGAPGAAGRALRPPASDGAPSGAPCKASAHRVAGCSRRDARPRAPRHRPHRVGALVRQTEARALRPGAPPPPRAVWTPGIARSFPPASTHPSSRRHWRGLGTIFGIGANRTGRILASLPTLQQQTPGHMLRTPPARACATLA